METRACRTIAKPQSLRRRRQRKREVHHDTSPTLVLRTKFLGICVYLSCNSCITLVTEVQVLQKQACLTVYGVRLTSDFPSWQNNHHRTHHHRCSPYRRRRTFSVGSHCRSPPTPPDLTERLRAGSSASHQATSKPCQAEHSTALPQALTAPLSPAPQRSQPDPREGQAVTVLTPQLFPTAVLWAHGSKPGRSPAAVSELKVMILAVITLGVRNRAAQTRACCSHSLPRGAFFTSVPLFPLLGAPPAERWLLARVQPVFF